MTEHLSKHFAGPIAERNRVQMLDVARGLALLGIFLVNIHFMAMPLGEVMSTAPASSEGLFSSMIFYGTKVFAESKTYPLFSLLFGIGLAMMYDRAKARGAKFGLPFVRRQAGLFVLGALHVVLLWYGDILLYYSLIGLAAMLLIKLKAKALAFLAALAIGLAMLMMSGLIALGMLGEAATTPTHEQPSALVATDGSQPVEQTNLDRVMEENAGEPPFTRLIEGFQSGEIDDPTHPVWRDAELEAAKHGPFKQAMLIRLINYISATVFLMILSGTGVQITGMFLLGMALHRWGFCDAEHRSIRQRTAIIGLGVGVPLAILAVALSAMSGSILGWGKLSGNVLTLLAGPVLAVSYLATAGVVVDRGWLRPVTAALSNMGRLALTNYLMQTFIVSVIVAHWGFGFFGEFDRVQRVALVLVIYAGQLAFSWLWLKAFAIGPIEWLLRSLTYLKVPRITRPKMETDAE